MTNTGAGGVNLSEWALRHRSFIVFLMLTCLITGVWSYFGLGRSEDPAFTVKQMLVKVLWPGASVEETVNLVSDKLEKKLEELPYLDYVRSQTKPGDSTIYLSLKDTVPAHLVPDLWYQVRKKVLDIWHTMPPGAQGPFFNDEFGDTFGIIYALTSDGFTHREMRDQAEKIRARLFRVPEVKKIDLLGVQDEKVYIEFSVSTMAALGLDPDGVVRAIQSPNTVVSAGNVLTENEMFVIRVSGAYRNEEDLRRVNLHTPSGFIRLGDIANVVRRYTDPPSRQFRFSGAPAIGLAIAMSDDGDTLRLGKAIKAEVAKIEADLPLGLELRSVADQAEVVHTAIDGFTKALFEAILIILVVGFIALGIRAGLVVAVSIPLVLAITFAAMYMAGIALQRISLGALIVALGLLVDDAMITVEMMIAKLEEGMDRLKAASFAYTSTAFPMLTGTIVTAVGFIPVGFAHSDAGEYSNSLFWVLAIALAASWVVAILFSPLIGIYLLPKQIRKGRHAEGRPARMFRAFLNPCLNRPILVLGATALVLAVSVFGATKLEQQFFPASDRGELVLTINLPQNSSIYATIQTVDRIEELLKKNPDVKHWSFYIGSGSARFYLPMEPPLPNPFVAQAIIVTKTTQARERVRASLWPALTEQFPNVVARLAPLELGPPVGWPVKYRVSGEEPAKVRQISYDVARVVSSDDQARDVNFDWNEPVKVVRFRIEQEKISKIGLTTDVIAQTLNAILNGYTVTQIRDATYIVDVVSRSLQSERVDLRTLRDLQIRVGADQSVPLSDLATIEYTDSQPLIWRRKRLPTITVQADIKDEQPTTVVGRIEPKMDELRAKLPSGYRIEMGGIVEDSTRAQKSVLAVVPLMLVIMMTVLMMQLQSFQRLFLVISVAPLGVIGIVAIMLPTGTPVGFIASLGVIALIGIIIRNSVILVDQIDTNVRGGQHPFDAVREATMHRVRPITLTALAAMLGMLPIAADVFWGPMAYAMIGGIAAATVLTLVFLPALYIVWFRIRPNPSPAPARG